MPSGGRSKEGYKRTALSWRLLCSQNSQTIELPSPCDRSPHQAANIHRGSSGWVRSVEVGTHHGSVETRRRMPRRFSTMRDAICRSVAQVGIIPTDTLPAVVCDMENRDAIRRLYLVKHMSLKKPLSLLVRGFADIGKYTTGFPVSNEPGVPATFNVVKQILPGPVSPCFRRDRRSPPMSL